MEGTAMTSILYEYSKPIDLFLGNAYNIQSYQYLIETKFLDF